MSLPNWEKNYNSLQNKVDKIEGKVLSSNDFTDEYKNKIDSMNNLIQIKSIDVQFSDVSNEDTANKVTINAVVPNGYKFICWISCSSVGWVSKGLNIDGVSSSTATIWTREAVQNPKTVRANYLVIKIF